MGAIRRARLFKNGRNRAVRIPVDLDFDGDEVTLRKQGDALIIEPVEKQPSLKQWLETIEPWDEEFPDVDKGLLPAEEVEL
ncbi:MAG: AbrB/MazE/SpoVT family DNA-binding domain-containing protein [Pseudomonadota bacterium]